MRKCNHCGEIKTEDSFAWKIKRDGLRQSRCRACQHKYGQRWYRVNRKKHIKRCVELRERAKQRIREFVFSHKSDHPCAYCGESDPIVLELHHRDGETKEFNIGEAVQKGLAVSKVKIEMVKCDSVCCNCHRRITAKKYGWWQLSRSSSGEDIRPSL